MKKIFLNLAIIASVALFSSCDSLNLEPEDYYSSNSFWNNKAQVQNFMNGIHSQLRDMYFMPITLGELRGAALVSGTTSLNTSSSGTTMVDNALTKDNTGGVTNWYNIYSRLLQVNLLIEQVEGPATYLTATEKAYFLGQAYGLRAYYYFYLYRTYGGVPLETTVKVLGGNLNATDLYLARSTAEETMKLIKSDIEKSVTNFETSGASFAKADKLIWNKYATYMLKGEIYMWSAKVTTGDHTATGKADLETAKAALLKVTDGTFSLLSDYSSLWDVTKKQNAEVIMALHFDKDEATNSGSLFVYESALFNGSAQDENGNVLNDPLGLINGGQLRYEYRESFVKSYDKLDSRRSATFLEYYMTDTKTGKKTAGAILKKMLGRSDSGTHYYDSDINIYRYSDCLLLLAECENGLGNYNGCIDYLNQVRKRAYGANYETVGKLTAGTFAENELAILHERDKELVGEGTRWFDVVRLHDAAGDPLVYSTAAVYPAVYGQVATSPLINKADSYKLLWPIDLNTLNADNLLVQTPGY